MNIGGLETQNNKPSAEVQAAVMQIWNVLREARHNILTLEEEKLLVAKKNEKLEEQLQQHAVAASKLQTYIEHLQAESRQRLQETDILKSHLESALTQIQNQKMSVSTLEEKLAEQQSIITAQQGDLEQIVHQKTEIKTLYELMEEKESELTTLQQQLDIAGEQTALLEKELLQQQSQNRLVEQLQQDLEIVRAELVRRNTEINLRYNEITEYKDRITELESRLLKAEQIISTTSGEAKEAEELRKALQDLQTQHQALVYLEDEETEETMVLQELVADLNTQLDEQSALLHNKEEEVQMLTAKLRAFSETESANPFASLTLSEKEQLTHQIRRIAERVEFVLSNAE